MALRLKGEKSSEVGVVGKVELLKSKPPSLVGVLEEAQELTQAEQGFLRPSSLYGCDRMCVFALTGSPKNPQKQDMRMMRILREGDKVHEIVQGFLAKHPDYWFAPESPVEASIGPSGTKVKGSCDGIMIRRSDGYRFAIEIKSKKHDSFAKLVKPDPDHIRQASIYAKLHKVWWIVIIYWDKDTQYLKEYPVAYDPERWSEIESRVEHLRGLADAAVAGGEGVLGGRHWDSIDPKKLPVFDPKKCDPGFCPYTTFCTMHGGKPSSVPKPSWW